MHFASLPWVIQGVLIHTLSFAHRFGLRCSVQIIKPLITQCHPAFCFSLPLTYRHSSQWFSNALSPNWKADSIIEIKQINFFVNVIFICQDLSRQFTTLRSRKEHIKISNRYLRRCMNTYHFTKRNYTALVLAEWSRSRKTADNADWRWNKLLTFRHVWKQEFFFSLR